MTTHTYQLGQSLQAIADAMAWGDTLILPPGPINAGGVRFANKVGIRIIGAGGVPGNWPTDPAEEACLSVVSGSFQFSGCIGLQLSDVVFMGGVANLPQSDPTKQPTALVSFDNGAGFGNTRNQIRRCSFDTAVDAIKNGNAQGDPNGDNLLIEDCSFGQVANAYHQLNDQAMQCRMTRAVANQIVTLLALDAGGVFTLDGTTVTSGADACPSIHARPLPNLASDWLIRLGSVGPNNDTITLRDLFIDGGSPSAAQIIQSSGTHNIDVYGFQQDLTPTPGRPLLSLTAGATVRFHGGRITGGTLGASVVQVAFDGTRCAFAPAPAPAVRRTV